MREVRMASITWIGLGLLFVCGFLNELQASTQVRVLETWPTGESVVLAPNQNFYLRLAYDTEQPASIWIRPFFRGKPVGVGTNPSPVYHGRGEAIGWFFFIKPGDVVDEIRVIAGDGRVDSTPTVATWRGQVLGAYDKIATSGAPPHWVTQMLEETQRAQNEAYQARMNEPVSAGDIGIFSGFMLGLLAFGVLGFVLPGWAVWHWQGIWRLLAAIPLAIMSFVVVRLVWDGWRDPTSHNLWPFEILIAGAICVASVGLLNGLRKLVKSG